MTTPTPAQLYILRSEASAAGDDAQVRLCDRALKGNVRALRECRRVLAAAAAKK